MLIRIIAHFGEADCVQIANVTVLLVNRKSIKFIRLNYDSNDYKIEQIWLDGFE